MDRDEVFDASYDKGSTISSKMFSSGSFFGHVVRQVNSSNSHQALINTAHQTRLNFDLEIDQPMVTSLRSGQSPMSVGDSAEEFISIHALGRERLLVLSCGLPSHPLKIMFFARRETTEFLSQFSIHQPPNVSSTEA